MAASCETPELTTGHTAVPQAAAGPVACSQNIDPVFPERTTDKQSVFFGRNPLMTQKRSGAQMVAKLRAWGGYLG